MDPEVHGISGQQKPHATKVQSANQRGLAFGFPGASVGWQSAEHQGSTVMSTRAHTRHRRRATIPVRIAFTGAGRPSCRP